MTITLPGIPAHKFDYDAELRDMLTSPLRKPNLLSIVSIFAQSFQEIEDLVQGIADQRLLERSIGVHLDSWGVIVGEARRGLVDGEYRSFIRARILSNKSQGEAPLMVEVLSIITRAIYVRYQPLYPAGMAFDYSVGDLVSSASRDRIKTQMQEIAASGVLVHYITEAQEGAFGFDDDDTALGYDEGGFAEVI